MATVSDELVERVAQAIVGGLRRKSDSEYIARAAIAALSHEAARVLGVPKIATVIATGETNYMYRAVDVEAIFDKTRAAKGE